MNHPTSKAVRLVLMRDLFNHNPARWWSTPELAKRLGVGERTVQRCLLDMDAIGCPIVANTEAERGRGYRYRRFQP